MIRTLAALCLTTSTAVACPTFDDLETGVVIRGANDSIYAVRQVVGDLYWHGQMSRMFPDQWHSFKHLGAFEAFVQRNSGSGKQFRTHSYDVEALEQIDETVAFTAVTEWGDPDGSALWSGELAFRVTPRDPVTIADCTYGALTIETTGTLTLPSGIVTNVSDTEIYLPELRFILPYGAMTTIAVATDEDEVPSYQRLLELARDTPMLGDVFTQYGLTP